MFDIINLRVRRINWIKIMRLRLRLSKVYKNLHRFLFNFIRKDKRLKLDTLYFLLFQREIKVSGYINAGTQFNERCYLTGQSRGVRWGIGRMTLLKLAYSSKSSSIFTQRW